MLFRAIVSVLSTNLHPQLAKGQSGAVTVTCQRQRSAAGHKPQANKSTHCWSRRWLPVVARLKDKSRLNIDLEEETFHLSYSAMIYNVNQILFHEMIHSEEHTKLLGQLAFANHAD